ncbi:hypothetical protein GA0070616_4394 [Micromonospora nigra]|uniref:Uncharacterized protein n=1 Tax=Micromonospora nigra TaxID=145857 RepID=A0A1C6SRP5_9ACTN|nr:hypothetical protein [Micromonospora nigra]SCL32137.1 hypothetical protein GA0070616_4394 [Micromonospora nigra]
MTGPEHYREAEKLLTDAAIPPGERDYTAPSLEVLLAAQVHATLALAAATAINDPDPSGSGQPSWATEDWEAVAFPGPSELPS